MTRTVLLFSGGLDSTSLLAQLMTTEEEILALSFKYGSLHEGSEMLAAANVIKYYEGVAHEVIQLPIEIFAGGSSALLGQTEMPNEEYHDITKETPSATVVPFRNANLISMAVSVANSRGFDQVAIANHATDSQGWAYPDCTPEFMGPMAAAVYIGTMRAVRLYTPFQFLTKADIVTLAARHRAPLYLTRSCYRGGMIACGECPTCLERITAFVIAGYVDPIKYVLEPRAWDIVGLKEFPKEER
jgi:7-cyano-7-deazaguanine synthase